MFCSHLDFSVRTNRAKHDNHERDATAKVFNDADTDFDVLFCSPKATACSVNLQGVCRKTIFLDSSGNINSILRGIDRIFRIGQTHEQHVWDFTMFETYDQARQTGSVRKFVGQLAGMCADLAILFERDLLYVSLIIALQTFFLSGHK